MRANSSDFPDSSKPPILQGLFTIGPENPTLIAEGGLVIKLSDWVLRQACRDAYGQDRACLAVNLSLMQFCNPDPIWK